MCAEKWAAHRTEGGLGTRPPEAGAGFVVLLGEGLDNNTQGVAETGDGKKMLSFSVPPPPQNGLKTTFIGETCGT